jgi:hypothetical protein
MANNDSVNHPRHYNSNPSGVECIDVVEHMTFNIGNAIKYLWRAGLKTPRARTIKEAKEVTIQDLKKARWYIDREIARISKGTT